jgi:Uma2 family endonuclease
MDTVIDTPWTIEQFLDWAGSRDGFWEFDGVRPVPMNGESALHVTIVQNLQAAFRARLRGTSWRYYGPGLGTRTVGDRVRYPDLLVVRGPFVLTERLAPSPVVVFEVVSPNSGPVDRITKLREYGAVPSIAHYAIIESRFPGVTLHSRAADGAWTVDAFGAEDEIAFPAIGLTLPVAEIYEDVDFGQPAFGTDAA